MQAHVLSQLKQPLVLETRPEPVPADNEVVVSLQAAAFNRRDYWITQGMYPGVQLPTILGSDGAGTVSAVGENVSKDWLEKKVLIHPGRNWGDRPEVQADSFDILGMPSEGTFAEQIAVPAETIYPVPAHLSMTAAAALPLAGVTAWRALMTQGSLQVGETVLVTGVGGGVATFALQFALAADAKVVVTSSSSDKRARALELGAMAAYDYRAESWHSDCREQQQPFDVIIDGAGGAGYAALLELARPGGRVVNYGSTAGAPPKLDLFKVFWKQLRLIGSTMGSPSDFEQMLAFIERHKVQPIVDEVLPFEEANRGMEMMRTSSQFGKIVLAIGGE